jgi:hypothetical protein
VHHVDCMKKQATSLSIITNQLRLLITFHLSITIHGNQGNVSNQSSRKHTQTSMWSAHSFYPSSTKPKISVNTPNIKFHENLSNGDRGVPYAQADSQTDITKPTVAFRDSANAPKKCQTAKPEFSYMGLIPNWTSEKQHVTRQAAYVQRNTAARSRNQCCRGKAVSIKCVCVCLYLLFTRSVKRIYSTEHYTVRYGLFGSTIYFHSISYMTRFCKKKVLNKNVFWFSLLLLSLTSLILGKIKQDIHN